MSIATAGAVAIKSQQPQAFQFLLEAVHDPLGAGSKGFECGGAAVTAALVDLFAVITPVTAQPAVAIAAAVNRERDIAVRALD